MTELEKCYGTDGTFVRVCYTNTNGTRVSIPEYKSFDHARGRCNNPNHIKFPTYGAKGIEFKFTNFSEWWNELGKKPTSGHTVDRIDGKGHYEVGNVRWATKLEQANNRIDVRCVLLTYPDGSQAEFESTAAASRSTTAIGKDSVRRMCTGQSRNVKGHQAQYIPKLTGE
jgi:hypothetical protein